MKLHHPVIFISRFSSATLLLLACALWPAHSRAEEQLVMQETFASPEDAIKSLQAAAAANDKAAMRQMFGPDIDMLMTGDEVQDADHARKFANAMQQGCRPVKDGEDKVSLEIGTNNWLMPIPLVKVNGTWRFDTEAGKQEIVERHIGKDELNAIGVCRAYVQAQKQYSSMTAGAGGGSVYALNFKSTPGSKDGLYWPAAENEAASPLGPLVAEAQMEGYGKKLGTGRRPFHGYFFKVLTAQGPAAPGGAMNYLRDGKLMGGFALVAFPQYWSRSGVMTFIVNQDGKVYQRNFGERTVRFAASLKAYNPDDNWSLVSDEGVQDAASEK